MKLFKFRGKLLEEAKFIGVEALSTHRSEHPNEDVSIARNSHVSWEKEEYNLMSDEDDTNRD